MFGAMGLALQVAAKFEEASSLVAGIEAGAEKTILDQPIHVGGIVYDIAVVLKRRPGVATPNPDAADLSPAV